MRRSVEEKQNPPNPSAGKPPLQGLRVLEVAQDVAGPYCTRLLADAGAQVVKVEPPGGDVSRRKGPLPYPEGSNLFHFLNAGKKSVVLELGQPTGRRGIMELAAWADLVVAAGTPGEMRRLGLTYRRLCRVNPGLILTLITPFGFGTPYDSWRVNDYLLWHMSGMGFATPGLPDYADDPEREPPLHPDAPAAGILAGGVAASATLCALMARSRDGRGRQVDIPAQAALVALGSAEVWPYSFARILRGRHAMRRGYAPNAIFPCKDGWVTIVAFQDHHWQQLVHVMGDPPWALDDRFREGPSRDAHWKTLELLIRTWTLQNIGADITRRTQEKGVPCFHYHSLPEAVASEHHRARRFFSELDVQGRRAQAPGVPIRLAGMSQPLAARGPRMGQDTLNVLEDIRGSAGRRTTASVSSDPPEPRLPLEGIRVVDLGQAVAIPFCSQWLAWMGAEVINVENSRRPGIRSMSPFAYDRPSLTTAAYFNSLNTNKRSLTVDLKTSEGLNLIRDLVRVSDVVIDNFGTGVMERLGVGYEQLRQIKPDICMLSLGAFGRTGPLKDYTGYHSAVSFFSGVSAVTGYREGRPRIMGAFLPDIWAGAQAFRAIVTALHQRRSTGQGQYIDASMVEVFMQLIPDAIMNYTMNGQEPARRGNRDALRAPQGVYRCRGWDAWVAVSVGAEEEWQALCAALDSPELARDPRFATRKARHRHHDELDAIITRWSRRHTHREAARLFQGKGVPAVPCLNPRDLLMEPHLRKRRMVVFIDHPDAGRRRYIGIPWAVSGLPPVRYRHAPAPGQDNPHVVRKLLGLPESTERRLRKAGALG